MYKSDINKPAVTQALYGERATGSEHLLCRFLDISYL